MTRHDLIDRVAELLDQPPGQLRKAGITNELNLQGWLSARNLRVVTADPREPEISPGFWIAEHRDGRCVVMFDESPYAASTPVDVPPDELRRALVLVPLDPTRASGSLPHHPAAAAGVVEALLTAAHAEDAMQTHEGVELRAGRGIVGDRYFDGTGIFSASEKHGQQLTLIEAEVLDALRDGGLHLTPVDARRNRHPRHRPQRARRPGIPDRNCTLHRPTAVRTVLASPAPHGHRPAAANGPPRRPPR
jgi:hypothetical protein